VAQDLVSQLLKRKYSTKEKVENASVIATRFMRDVNRMTDPGGESFNSFLTISGGVGWSGTRAGAQVISDQGGNRGNGQWQQLRNSYGKIAGEVRFDEFAVKQANSKDASALRAIGAHVDNHLKMHGQTAEWQLLGHRGMFLCSGTISSGVFSITSSPEHINRIRGDLVCVASTANGTSGSLVSSGSQGFVVGVGRSGASPTITFSATSGGSAGSPTGWEAAGTIFLFVVGTNFASNGGAGVDGGVNQEFMVDTLDSWVPETPPGATLFKGMNRTVDEVLGGVRMTAAETAGKNILQIGEELAVIGRSRFGWQDDGFINFYVHTRQFSKASQLLQRTDIRQQGYSGQPASTQYGYEVIEMRSTGARVRFVDTPMMDTSYGWMTDPKKWLLHSSAGWPNVMDDDGLRFIRKPTEDAYALQYTGYGSFRTEDPSKTARAPLPSPY
jgi:hypothetical protein